MKNIALMVVAILSIASYCVAYPQELDQNLIVMKQGESRTIVSAGLTGIYSGSIFILSISDFRGDRATIAATGIGETTLELIHKDRSKKILRLRVESRSLDSRTTPSGIQPVQIRASNPNENNANKAAIETGVKPETPVVRVDDGASHATRPRRVQFAVDFIYVSESETFPVVTDHPDDGHEDHLHTDDTVQASRKLMVVPLTVRFLLDHRNTFTATIPYIRRTDEISFSGQTTRSRNQGLGDIQLAFDRHFNPAWEGWTGTWGIGVRLPTGKSVYNITTGESPIGAGHWELSGSAGLSKLFDQIVFRGKLEVNYAVPRVVNGVQFRPGWGHGIQTGIDYLASDRWTVSQQLVHIKRQNVFLTTPLDTGTEIVSQTYLSHSLFFQPKRLSHAYRLRFDIGLNNTASDLSVGLGYQW